MTTMDLRGYWPVPSRFPREITAAVVVSILLHVALLLIPMREKMGAGPAGVAGPLTVELELPPRRETPPPMTRELPKHRNGPPPRNARDDRHRAPVHARALQGAGAARRPSPRSPPEASLRSTWRPSSRPTGPGAPRWRRRPRGPQASTGQAASGLVRGNLESLSTDDGTGGVFQILRIGARTRASSPSTAGRPRRAASGAR